MKNKKVSKVSIAIFIGLSISCLIIGLTVLIIKTLVNDDKPKTDANITVKSFNEETISDKVTFTNGSNTYYYIDESNVYALCDEKIEQVYNGNDPSMISTNGNELVVLDNNEIVILNINNYEILKIISSDIVSKIFACNKYLFYIQKLNDEYNQLCTYDLKSYTELDFISILPQTNNAYNKMQLSDDFQVIAITDNDKITALEVVSNDFTPVFQYNTYGLYEIDDNLLSLSVKSSQLIQESINDESKVANVISLPKISCYSDNFIIEDNKFITIGTDLEFPPFKAKAIDFSPELSVHGYDVISIVDMHTSEVESKMTNRFERILYVNKCKAITYYDGEYLTYSIDDWKVTDKQDADEIKDGGSYTFEACGDYIFVFDDDTDEMINTIKV